MTGRGHSGHSVCMQRTLLAVLIAVSSACASAADSAPTATTTASSSTEADTSSTGGSSAVEAPSRVTCGTQYRPVGGSAAGEAQDSLSVERPAPDAPRAEVANLSFADFDVSITYTDDGHETPALLVRVSMRSGGELERVLFQFGPPLPNFSGGHGFTGLHYVYSGEAELQWWCTAQG